MEQMTMFPPPYKYLIDVLHSGERIVLEIFDPQ